MLDAFADQGASLRQARPPAPARLITLVSQGEERYEQALLWQLCQALQSYGYPPVVLDGTSLESPRIPAWSTSCSTRPGARWERPKIPTGP